MGIDGVRGNVLTSQLFSTFPDIRHGTSTKAFGPLSFKKDPDENEVLIDRARFFRELGIPLTHAVSVCEYNHTDHVVIIGEADEGRGIFSADTQIPDTDAMVTDRPDVALVIYTADCLPVIFYDPVRRVIAAAHSGWRGTAKRIVVKTIETMQRTFACEPSDIRVYIGPSIGPCCYAVRNPEALAAFEGCAHVLISREGRAYLDLWRAVENDLLAKGITPEHIECAGVCTACHTDQFASHYVEGAARTMDNWTVIAMG